MYKDHRILCVIPARSGSKGLPGKNIKELLGKPLIAYTIEHAKQSRYIDRVVVSTDNQEIADISRRYGAEIPFIRPQELATDDVGSIEVLLHAIEWIEKQEQDHFNILVLLQATSPIREQEDVDNCIELLVEGRAESVFSVMEAHGNPYFNMVEVSNDKTIRLSKKGIFTARQLAPKVFRMNGSIYIWWTEIFKQKKTTILPKSQIYVMSKERSVDIDDYIDFKIAEILLREKMSHVSYY